MRKGQIAAHYAVVAAICGASYCTGIEGVRFHRDESQWIATSYYLEALLGEPIDKIRWDVPRPLWGGSYEILTQPPLVRYVIGVGRRLGGFGVEDLNGKWNFRVGAEANEAAGNMPSERLLLWSRRPMVVLSILSGLMLFSIAWSCGGLVCGYLAALGFAFNPYLLQTLRRAMGEATLTFFVVLALVAADCGVRASWTPQVCGTTSRAGLRVSPWWLVAGFCCGLAGAAKLNGLFAAGGLALAASVAALSGSRELSPPVRRRGAVGVLAILLTATAVGFVAPNPYLHPYPASRPGPVSRMLDMWTNRFYEMASQQSAYPQSRLDGVAHRAQAAARRVFVQHALLQFPGAWLINVGFTLAGLVVLARRGLRSVIERRPGTELVVLGLAGSLVVPAIFTPLDWERYYLFPVLFAGLSFAVGVSAAAGLALTRAPSST